MIHGHITIVDKVHVSAGTLALRSILEPGQYTGFYPIAEHRDWEKSAALVRNLGTMREKIRALEKSLKTLTQEQAGQARFQRIKKRMNSLDINQIKQYLPHRYPLLLVDRVLNWESGKTITAIKNVTVNEEFFNGHFPHKPVMPGVLMIEALAQTAALLSFLTEGRKPDENTVVYFVGIDNARFKRPVEPGDQLKMEVEITRRARHLEVPRRGHRGWPGRVEGDLMCTMRSAADASQSA
jgi:3-hydroxyacyl-[acyl-carrier-protein] dehydratase